MLRELTHHEGRSLLLAVVPRVAAWDGWPRTTPYFRLVVHLDKEGLPEPLMLRGFAQSALDAGARAILCGGTAGEIVHDAFDMAILGDKPPFDGHRYMPEPGDNVLTTWHDGEPLKKVLWNAFYAIRASDRFEACNPPVVAVFVEGDPRIDSSVRIAGALEKVFHDLVERDDT